MPPEQQEETKKRAPASLSAGEKRNTRLRLEIGPHSVLPGSRSTRNSRESSLRGLPELSLSLPAFAAPLAVGLPTFPPPAAATGAFTTGLVPAEAAAPSSLAAKAEAPRCSSEVTQEASGVCSCMEALAEALNAWERTWKVHARAEQRLSSVVLGTPPPLHAKYMVNVAGQAFAVQAAAAKKAAQIGGERGRAQTVALEAAQAATVFAVQVASQQRAAHSVIETISPAFLELAQAHTAHTAASAAVTKALVHVRRHFKRTTNKCTERNA